MYGTLHHSEFVLVNKLAYVRSEPQHGDIIVFNYPNDPSEQFVKRIIAIPGDTIEIRQGVVYVNGEKVIEPYINKGTQLAAFPIVTSYPARRSLLNLSSSWATTGAAAGILANGGSCRASSL